MLRKYIHLFQNFIYIEFWNIVKFLILQFPKKTYKIWRDLKHFFFFRNLHEFKIWRILKNIVTQRKIFSPGIWAEYCNRLTSTASVLSSYSANRICRHNPIAFASRKRAECNLLNGIVSCSVFTVFCHHVLLPNQQIMFLNIL